MKRTIIIVFCSILLFSCREQTIPTVSLNMLPADILYISPDTILDTIPYRYNSKNKDTIYVDTIPYFDIELGIDTFLLDSFQIDTFCIDIVQLNAKVSYQGSQPFGPALQELGFCVYFDSKYMNDSDNVTLTYPVVKSAELQTPQENYGPFMYILPAKSTDVLYVYAYACNPYGISRSETATVDISKLRNDTTVAW